MAPVLIVVVFAVILLNVAASLWAHRCLSLSARQRLFQHALIWLVPLAGAVASLVFVGHASRDPFGPQELQRKRGEDGVYHDTDVSYPDSGSD
jgi:hypothetical protein